MSQPAAAAAPPPPQQQQLPAYEPTGNALLDLILQPGSSTKLVPVINITLFGLLAVLCVLQAWGESNIHLTVMGVLAVGLMASVNWFISEYKSVKAQEQARRGVAPAAGGTAKEVKAD